jgi:hypothetical protein
VQAWADCIEVWASPTVLLTLDGRVLEVFGFADAQRFHIAFRPVLLFTGKSRLTIRPEHGGQWTFFYDPARRPEVERFAAQVLAAHGAWQPSAGQ